MRSTLIAIVLASCVAAGAASSAGDVAVISGSFQGVPWRLSATDSKVGSYCITIVIRHQFDSSSCGSIHNQLAHGISYVASNGRPTPNYVAGPVDGRARYVRITFLNGKTVTTATVAPPSRLAQNIRFYIRFAHCYATHPVRIVGVDQHGATVASLSVRLLGGPKTTC